MPPSPTDPVAKPAFTRTVIATPAALAHGEPALLSKALSLASAFAFEMGEDGHLDFVNRADLSEYLGVPQDDFETSQESWETRLSDTDQQARRAAIASLKNEQDRYQIDYQISFENGVQRSVREIGEALACADSRATFIRGVLLDQTDHSGQDALTGLPDISRLKETGTLLAQLSDRVGIPLHLLRIRLKNLDKLAQSFGPEVESMLLRQAGERLQDSLRSPDRVSRLDRRDFVAITLNSDPDTLGLRLRAAVTAEPYDTPHGSLALEVDVVRARLSSVEDALERTQGKLTGEPDLQEAAPVWPGVKEAIDDGRLSLAFQPIVSAKSHELHHFEALLRIQSETGAMQSAFPFITQAEANGEVHHLDRYVLDQAAELLRDDPNLRLAINVSAGTVGQEDHSAAYVDALTRLGSLAQRLTLELTETLAIDDPGVAARFSANVRALGCQFAVDDFASGHTSFQNLIAVQADAIKMDGSLVRGVALDENKQAFIRVMVDLAATFDVETVAEMVEDRADADMLSRLGVTYLQGYYFGHPTSEPIWAGLSQGS